MPAIQKTVVELSRPITEAAVDEIFRRARQYADDSSTYAHVANQGYKAAKARDPRLMRCLELCAEVVGKMNERQLGQTQRTRQDTHVLTIKPAEVQLLQEAYRCADAGQATMVYGWLYGAAATFCGVAYH